MTLLGSVAGAAVTTASPLKAIKIVFWTVVVIFLVAAAGGCYWMYGEMQKAKVENGVLTERVRTLSHDMDMFKLGQSAMGLGQTLSDQMKEEMDKKARQVRNDLAAKEKAIDKLNATAEEKSRMKSVARMDSVWDTFCFVQPTNAICSKRTITEKASETGDQPVQQEPSK